MRQQIGKYLDAWLIETDGKTVAYNIFSINKGTMLGEVKWYGPWRQYCFFPLTNTVFNGDCLVDLRNFLKGLTDKRKAKP